MPRIALIVTCLLLVTCSLAAAQDDVAQRSLMLNNLSPQVVVELFEEDRLGPPGGLESVEAFQGHALPQIAPDFRLPGGVRLRGSQAAVEEVRQILLLLNSSTTPLDLTEWPWLMQDGRLRLPPDRAIVRPCGGDAQRVRVAIRSGRVTLPEEVVLDDIVQPENAIHLRGPADALAEAAEQLQALDFSPVQLALETLVVYRADGPTLPRALVANGMAMPSMLICQGMTEGEIEQLKNSADRKAGYSVLTRDGLVEAASVPIDTNGDGAGDIVAELKYVAYLDGDRIAFQVNIATYDYRNGGGAEPETLSVMLRMANGETAALAHVGKDGAILDPVYLLTARALQP